MAKTLHLDALTERVIVTRKNGETFEMRMQDELPPMSLHRLAKAGRRIDVLIAKDNLTDEEEAELERLPFDMCKVLVDGIDPLTLDEDERWAVCKGFSNPSAVIQTGPATDALKATGAKSPRR